MRTDFDVNRSVAGFVRFMSLNLRTGILRKVIERKNLILYGGADILAQLLSGDPAYAVRYMYLEFKNLANPLDPITPPPFDRSGGRSYYEGLVSSPDTDFLRVPLTGTPALSSSDALLYSFNTGTFFAMSEGAAGIHGKTFAPGSNSAVFGAALVATPDPDDRSKDVVFSRVYSGIDKILKESGFEIGVSWAVRFK